MFIDRLLVALFIYPVTHIQSNRNQLGRFQHVIMAVYRQQAEGDIESGGLQFFVETQGLLYWDNSIKLGVDDSCFHSDFVNVFIGVSGSGFSGGISGRRSSASISRSARGSVDSIRAWLCRECTRSHFLNCVS